MVIELEQLRDRSASQQHELEKKLRASKDQNRILQENVDDVQTELSTLHRQHKYQLQDFESQQAALQQTITDTRDALTIRSLLLQSTQDRLKHREAEVGRLESEVLQLKAQALDSDDLATVKRELSKQISHMRKLEKTNREQTAELRHLRQVHKAVEIVEEEKRTLENKVRSIDELRRELGEAQLQRQMLEDERKSWASYLEGESAVEFDSPQAVARALARERLERASLFERLGAVRPEVSEKEAIIANLAAERNRLLADMERLKAGGGASDSRAKSRLERQKALAVKEVDYLREQLQTFENGDVTDEIRNEPEEQARKRIQELESLLSQYRTEVQVLSNDLSTREDVHPLPDTQTLKRPREEDSDERLGELSRKNRKLHTELTALQQSVTLLSSDLAAAKSQLSALEARSRIRILALRSNPTDDHAAHKRGTIASLREENTALRAQLASGSSPTKVVPISALHNARLEISELQKEVAEKEKRMLRLKQIWALKTTEFREAVASLLGWKMEFMPAGRFRMTSIFYPGDDGGGGENSLIFDGDSGSMKIGGGPQSEFAAEIRGLIRFWVDERKEIPALLAAMTLEFYERTTRAQKM